MPVVAPVTRQVDVHVSRKQLVACFENSYRKSF